jgi:hypothetical protein
LPETPSGIAPKILLKRQCQAVMPIGQYQLLPRARKRFGNSSRHDMVREDTIKMRKGSHHEKLYQFPEWRPVRIVLLVAYAAASGPIGEKTGLACPQACPAARHKAARRRRTIMRTLLFGPIPFRRDPEWQVGMGGGGPCGRQDKIRPLWGPSTFLARKRIIRGERDPPPPRPPQPPDR